eukprot:COSAG01_NODE_12622_length_1709_cov_6.138509_2_plen_106_part_00
MAGKRQPAGSGQRPIYLLFFDPDVLLKEHPHNAICNLLVAPFVEPMCVSGHCAPQPRFYSAIVWGAYDMWMFRGSKSWSQWGVVHRVHVLLACRKFWFSNMGASA